MRNRSIAFGLAALAAAPAAAQQLPEPVQTPQPAVGQAGDQSGDEVVVTGSRGQQRTVTDSPTPIDVLGGPELEKTGRPGLLSALNTLVPSFNVPTRAGGGTSTVISTGGLRGLNPDQTLILVNGKRRHKTSLINAVSSLYNGSVPVDLDLVPTSAIDHIEVLRDGAAAQYGSDAIAGVINIILKKRTDGGDASVTAGQNFDRSDGENYLGQVAYGMALGDAGYLDLSLNGRKQLRSNRAIPIDRSIQLYNRIGAGAAGVPDPREATIDRLVTTNYGAFPVEGINGGYNAGYDLGGVELYSFGTYSWRDSELNFTYRAPNNAASLPEVYPNGFRPRLNIREQDYEFALGATGDIAGWNWDVSTTYGRNRSRQQGYDTINASLGPNSPTSFYVGTLRSTEWVNSLDVTRGVPVGGGNLQLSGGLQHRRETYAVLQGSPGSYAAGSAPGQTYSYINSAGVRVTPPPGAQAAAGFTPADEGRISRNNYAAYVDVAYDPSDRLTLGVAGRYEHYDDASGDTVTGKANARYAFTDWVALRGAVSNGFRAPALAQQIYASTTGQFRTVNGVPNQLLQIKTLPVGSPAAVALGSQPLTPEKSTNFSAGIVLTPARALNVTIDAYQIKVRDRIAITSTLTGPAVSAILIANGQSSDISAQYYTNAIDTRTRGIDVVATYRLDVGDLGTMRLNAGFNYNKTIITDIAANPPQLAQLGAGFVLFDRLSQGNLTNAIPRTKLFLGDVWTLGDFTFTGRLVRYGKFAQLQNLVAQDRYFSAKWIADAEIAWQATKGLNVAIGANNLFNTYPDRNGLFNASLGNSQYPTTAPYGFTGGSYYARVGVAF
ncbi:MAG: TonB-dependent receptor [Sphingomonas fennica]